MSVVKKLLKTLKKNKRIFIQTHDFPDHDAVATAFSLQFLLKSKGFDSTIIYHGEILRENLQKMIAELEIDISHHYKYELSSDDLLVIVDACAGNKNVTELKAKVVAVIDHHQTKCKEKYPFIDIRSDYGACSTILFSYFAELKLEPSQNIATALLAGINFDTHSLSRQISPMDLQAYSMLYNVGDVEFVSSMVRNNISLEDLPDFQYLLSNYWRTGYFSYCYFPQGCNKNLLAILSDFMLSLEEVEVSILCAKNNKKIYFSVRSERKNAKANEIIQKALKGIGSGGGHTDMAGGVIFDGTNFDSEKMYNKFQQLMKQEMKITFAR